MMNSHSVSLSFSSGTAKLKHNWLLSFSAIFGTCEHYQFNTD